MSTQSSGFLSTSLSISQPFQNVRLLEVPDELLDIIANSTESLYFKSSPSLDNDTATKEGNLHLCSNDKAWLVKQVSTSNSVYITKATKLEQHQNGSAGDDDHNMTDEHTNEPSVGITAIAKPTNILELHPIPTTNHETTVSEHLNHLIPTIGLEPDSSIISQYSIQDLYGHIPAPTSIIKRILTQKCIFEQPWSIRQFSPSDPFGVKADPTKSPPNAKAYAPTPALILETWRKICEAATIFETSITGNLEADVLLEASADSDSADTSASDRLNIDEIYKAVARKMFGRDGYFVALGLITEATNLDTKDELNEIEMSRWVGNMILEVEAGPHGTIEKDDFERRWDHAVPAAWSKYCSVEVLSDACKVTASEHGKNMVSWWPFALESAVTSTANEHNVKVTNVVHAAPAKGKRKWHEKFAAQRKAKK
ncbi:hypothetical protein PMZ80_008325 [Knufia obscura]|uniref:Sister chromatid cohesion protein Dcc1 n=2 Tax=Knufia TaxID=430999 RepID=A0AAN8EJW7_9EURO|nr:hypothetical protein PMZ80_008325 [Knufia obscura]KAK5951210.1 hypothetical protein OHC33_007628 [Knufia fluminis]